MAFAVGAYRPSTRANPNFPTYDSYESSVACAWLSRFVPPSSPSVPETICTSSASDSDSFSAARKRSYP